MIPKIIHYCWFGRGKKPELVEKCIRSWEKYCPDYILKEWNEDNFDIEAVPYVKEAYEAKKYAFVADYVRLFAMYHEGGIYLDSDVEVVRGLDEFLNNVAFTGFESDRYMVTGTMGAEKNSNYIGEMLSYYEGRHFVNTNGDKDLTTNTTSISDFLQTKGFIPNGEFQKNEEFALYPRDYFCPYDYINGKMYKTSNTATIHWFNMSWIEPENRFRSKITKLFHRVFGNDCFSWVHKLLRK